MRKLKFLMWMIFVTGMLMSFSSCLVVHRHDNGKHVGWRKNNPEHPRNHGRTVWVKTTNNPKQTTIKIKKAKPDKKSNKNQWDAKR